MDVNIHRLPRPSFFLKRSRFSKSFPWALMIMPKIAEFLSSNNPAEVASLSIFFHTNIAIGVARIFFGGGERLSHLKAITRPPEGVRGRRPPDGSEVSFFKTMQSIRKWIEFSKIATFFLPKKSIFSKKNFEKLNIFDGNFWIFSNHYLKIFNFYETYKSREIFGEFYYLIEKFMKKLKKSLDREGLLKMAWKFLKFLENIDWNLY